MSDLNVKQEKRFAVVMYGGVSLAIYINGVAQEFYRLVKSTAAETDPASLTSSEVIYRELGEKLQARFVVDVLAGTSAGGINAVFLAKALANDQSFKTLEELWVTEGDIEKLVYDKKSVDETDAAKHRSDVGSPKSLLNGYRMYDKLLEAFEKMGADTQRALVSEVDLFVTATDLQGRKVPIRLSDEVVHERAHREVFHFRKAPNGRNDFVGDNNPMLAFAARCTSSFPMAFEPVRLDDLAKDNPKWRHLYGRYEREGESKGAFRARAFSDGGYLDNKPFTYAIEAIRSREPRQPDLPTDRKLVYIEPSPERFTRDTHIDPPPNALANAFKAFTLARYETIQEDLRLIRRRNRLIERVSRIHRGTEDDISRLTADKQPLNVGGWLEADLLDMIERHGIAYAGYLRLRVARLTDDLTEIIANHANFAPDSDEFLAIRYLVRKWRDQRYEYYDCHKEMTPPPANMKRCFNHFILALDLGFHLRRLEFCIGRIDDLLLADENGGRICEFRDIDPEIMSAEEFRNRLENIRVIFSEARKSILKIRTQLRTRDPSSDAGVTACVNKMGLKSPLLIKRILELDAETDRMDSAEAVLRERESVVDELYRCIEEEVSEAHTIIQSCKEEIGLLIAGNPVPWSDEQPPLDADKAQWLVQFYFRMFSHYDLIAYPILQTPELGEEIDEVQVVRISPADPGKLGGSRIAHFGAFFDRTWRKNDILRGRLDGAERIIATLLPGEDNRVERDHYTKRAHLAIMKEIVDKNGDRMDLLSDVLLGSTADDREKTTRVFNNSAESPPSESLATKIEDVLKGEIDEEKLYERFSTYAIDPSLDPELVVKTLSRSTRVAGKVLTSISDEYGGEGGRKLTSRVANVGAISSLLVEALLPGTWRHLVVRHWLRLLILFSAVMLIGSWFLNFDGLTKLGGVLLGAALFFQVLGLSLRRAVRTRRFRPLWILAAVIIIPLLLVGVLYTPEALSEVWERCRNVIESAVARIGRD